MSDQTTDQPPTVREPSIPPKPAPIVVLLDPAQLELLIAALASHRWRRADEQYRDGWNIIGPGTDDPKRHVELADSQLLIDKFKALLPKTPVIGADPFGQRHEEHR